MNVAELYLNNVPLKEIEAITGIPVKKLEYLIYHKMGLKREPIQHPKAEKVRRLVNWGYNASEIAEGEGIKLKTVERILRDAI